MERVFYVKLKNFNFATFGGHLGFLRKTENVNISETARDRVILTEFFKRNISAEVRVVPLYLGLMVTPLIVGEHSLFPRLQF